jgi:ubiquitin-protein ligase
MSSKRLKRIANEINELQKSIENLKDNGIYFHYNEDDMNIIYAMLIGPEKTPYEKGFYFFKIEYSQNYPMEPPIVKYYTQGYLNNPLNKTNFNVRFNPNLYTCGKVCLSMLNTWTGPGWVPTNTLTNVLIAIQALVFNEEPLRNEPGFENSNNSVINEYNKIIEYANIKISLLEMIFGYPKEFSVFENTMCDFFLKNIDFYRNFVIVKNEELKNNLIESPAYGMKVKLDYSSLLNKIDEMEMKIINEKLTNNTSV